MNTFFSTKVLIKQNNIEAKRSRIARVTIALCFFISISFSLIFSLQDIYPFNLVFIFYTLFYVVAYFILNNINEYVGKVIFYLGIVSHTFCLCLFLGDYSQFKLIYIPISIVPLLIFSKDEKITMYIMLALTLTNIILINTTIHLFEINQRYDQETTQLIGNAFEITCMLCLVFLALLFLQLTEAIEVELLYANNELSNEKKKAQKINFLLNKAKEDQERMNLMKDHLFRVISHDLRSPINTIHGLTEILTTTTLTQDQQSVITENLKRSAENTTHLLDNLLKWSVFQINNSTQTIIDTINVSDLVTNIFNQVDIKAREKSLNLLMTIDSNLSIYADINMLEIVLRNLISNAIKFSYDEHTVSVIAEKQDEKLIIKVIDTGIGIPQEIIDKLYTNDRSVSRLGTHNEKGTGIGLLLCKNLLENCGGTIDIISTPTYKTVFTIKLPINLNQPNLKVID